MTQKLIQALARERRFSRNVAHELRTPLAEARMLAEVGAIAENPEQARKSFEEIGKATQELEQIVEALLSLSRYESGIQKPEPEPVDLVVEIRRHANRLQGAARSRGLDLQLDVAEEAWVYVDLALVRRLLANLLGNAVAHAPVGATIHTRLLRDGSFSIDNPAPQLHEADLPRLGERFFRIQSGTGGPHAGLGFSLATAVARILGLEMRLSLTPEHHLVASVTGFKALPG